MKLFKRLTAAVLAVSMTLSAAAFQGITAFADETTATFGAWYETAYATWPDTAAASAEIYYKGESDSGYTQLNSSGDLVAESLSYSDGSNTYSANGYKNCVVRQSDDSTGRVDIPGLEAGTYNILIKSSTGTEYSADVTVLAEDRSGYAHFNRPTESSDSDNSYNGVGAYTDDGTPMDDADIIYITEGNKNTVTYGNYTGFGNIAANIRNISTPLIIRFIGEIETTTWTLSGTTITESSDETPINGLLNRFYIGSNSYTFSATSSYETYTSDNDTYIGMMDFKADSKTGYSGFSNVTLEGIGTDAEFVNWGVSFRYCNSIEVKNITFTSYQEDGCSAQDSTRIWFHRCTFNKGSLACDLSDDKDKADGDGSSDLNACKNATISYCVYNNAHKTSLSGNGDSTKQWNYTYHHNYYNNCYSRLPLARYVNVHSYNNYTVGAGLSAISARASAFVFSEANYYENTTNVFDIHTNTSNGSGFVKSYGDTFDSTSQPSSNYILYASSRTSTISVSSYDSYNQHNSGGTDEYINNFDVDSDNFYYSNGASNVSYLTDAATAKTDAVTYSGVMKDSATTYIDITSDGYTTIEDNQYLKYNEYDTTSSSYNNSTYFQGTGSITYNENFMRFTSSTSVSFKAAAGATIIVKAKNGSGSTAGTLTFSGKNTASVTESFAVDTTADYNDYTFVSKSSAEDIYTLTATGNMNIKQISVTFGDSSDEPTETTTEAGVIYDTAELTFSEAETISEATTMCNYFSITPSMTVDKSSKTVNGKSYTYRIKSGGVTKYSSGVPSERAISFKTAGSAVVQFCAAAANLDIDNNETSRSIYIYKDSDFTNKVDTIDLTSTDPVMTKICKLSGAGTYYITFSAGINIYDMTVAVGRSVTTDNDGNGYIFTDGSDSYAVVGIASADVASEEYSTLTVTAVSTNTIPIETDTVYEYATVDDGNFVIKPSFLGSDSDGNSLYGYLYVVKIEGSGGATDFTYSSTLS